MKNILILAILSFLLSGCWEVSNGYKIGTLVKLADEGVFIKTHEGQIIRGGMNNGSGSFGHPFDFTIENKNTYDAALSAMDAQKEVKIYYHIEFVSLWRAESHSVFVDKIEVLN